MFPDIRMRCLELVMKHGSERTRQNPIPEAEKLYAWVTDKSLMDKPSKKAPASRSPAKSG